MPFDHLAPYSIIDPGAKAFPAKVFMDNGYVDPFAADIRPAFQNAVHASVGKALYRNGSVNAGI